MQEAKESHSRDLKCAVFSLFHQVQYERLNELLIQVQEFQKKMKNKYQSLLFFLTQSLNFYSVSLMS